MKLSDSQQRPHLRPNPGVGNRPDDEPLGNMKRQKDNFGGRIGAHAIIQNWGEGWKQLDGIDIRLGVREKDPERSENWLHTADDA
jgi:hypothetical protein